MPGPRPKALRDANRAFGPQRLQCLVHPLRRELQHEDIRRRRPVDDPGTDVKHDPPNLRLGDSGVEHDGNGIGVCADGLVAPKVR